METKKYHITIKENETGEVHYDFDSNIILGAVYLEDGEIASVAAAHGSTFDVAATIDAVNTVIKKVGEHDPMALLLSKLLGKDEAGVRKTIKEIDERGLDIEE